MAYLSATELNPHLPGRLGVTASSAPDIAGALTIITGISAEIDAAARQGGYLTPVPTTSPVAFSMLQLYTVYGAGWQVLNVMMPDQGGPKDKTALASTYRERYEAALAGLRDGSISLADAPEDTTGAGGGRILPRSYSTSNPGATVGVVPKVSIAQEF